MNRSFAITFGTLLLFASSIAAATTAIPCAVNPSNSACMPTVSLSWTVNGTTNTAMSSTPAFTNGNWMVTFTPQDLGSTNFTGGQLTSNPDAFLSFAFGVINNATTNMVFTYDFTTPYFGNPIGSASTNFTDRLLHITPSSQATSNVSPAPGTYLQTSLVNSAIIPNFQLGLGCTTASACSSAGPYNVFEAYSAPGAGTLEIKGQFTLTPNSNYTIQGATYLYPVPEPTSLLLLGTGLTGLARLIRRKRNV